MLDNANLYLGVFVRHNAVQTSLSSFQIIDASSKTAVNANQPSNSVVNVVDTPIDSDNDIDMLVLPGSSGDETIQPLPLQGNQCV